jgi:hypothetical protein
MENKSKLASVYRELAKTYNDLAEIIGAETSNVEVKATATTVAKTTKAAAPVETKATTAAPVSTREQFDEMKYNDLKSLAKKMGLDCTGNREAITERMVKASEKVEAPVEEDESEDVSDETNDVQAQVEAAVKDMSDTEIADLLVSIEISPKGKRQALIAKLVKAVEDGKIALDGDDEESDENTDSTDNSTAEEEEESEVADYFPEDVTEARETACDELEKELKADYKKKGITDKEIAETCEAFYLEHEGYDAKLPKDEKLKMYIEATQRMIDDEGEQHEFQEPYEMNGQSACCGHYLKELENGNLYCEICGQEFETE